MIEICGKLHELNTYLQFIYLKKFLRIKRTKYYASKFELIVWFNQLYIWFYIYIYMCVCVCVCVCILILCFFHIDTTANDTFINKHSIPII